MAQPGTASTSLRDATNLGRSPTAPLAPSRSRSAPFVGVAAARTTTLDTFAVDPELRVGYAQQWQLSVQRDLPFSLQMVVTYSGIKGTRGVQEILPNSYAPG